MASDENEPLVVDLDEDEAQSILETRLNVLRSLPQDAQNAAILEELVTLTFTLQNAVQKMRAQTILDIKTEAERVREETARIRRRVAFTIVAAVITSFLLTIGANNYAIKKCFLGTTSQLKHSSVCNTIFPGYNKQVDQSHLILDKFNTVLSEIPRNTKRLNALDKRLARIEHQLKRVGVRSAGHA